MAAGGCMGGCFSLFHKKKRQQEFENNCCSPACAREAVKGTEADVAIVHEGASSKVQQVAWRLDNSALQADTDGLVLRKSKDLEDRDDKLAADWDSIIMGVDEGDGWLRVADDYYLPMSVHGRPVLTLAPGREGEAKLMTYEVDEETNVVVKENAGLAVMEAPDSALHGWVDKLSIKVSELEETIARTDKEARELVSQGSTVPTAKARALNLIKRKKQYKEQRDNLMAAQFNIENMVIETENAQVLLSVKQAMQQAVTQLKCQRDQLGGVSAIDALTGERLELQAEMQQIQEELSSSISTTSELDAAAEAELAELYSQAQEEASRAQEETALEILLQPIKEKSAPLYAVAGTEYDEVSPTASTVDTPNWAYRNSSAPTSPQWPAPASEQVVPVARPSPARLAVAAGPVRRQEFQPQAHEQMLPTQHGQHNHTHVVPVVEVLQEPLLSSDRALQHGRETSAKCDADAVRARLRICRGQEHADVPAYSGPHQRRVSCDSVFSFGTASESLTQESPAPTTNAGSSYYDTRFPNSGGTPCNFCGEKTAFGAPCTCLSGQTLINKASILQAPVSAVIGASTDAEKTQRLQAKVTVKQWWADDPSSVKCSTKFVPLPTSGPMADNVSPLQSLESCQGHVDCLSGGSASVFPVRKYNVYDGATYRPVSEQPQGSCLDEESIRQAWLAAQNKERARASTSFDGSYNTGRGTCSIIDGHIDWHDGHRNPVTVTSSLPKRVVPSIRYDQRGTDGLIDWKKTVPFPPSTDALESEGECTFPSSVISPPGANVERRVLSILTDDGNVTGELVNGRLEWSDGDIWIRV